MIRRASLVLVGALMGATAMGVIYTAVAPAEAAGTSTYKELSIFGDVFERVRAQYVAPASGRQTCEAAINGMPSLDPHSSYMRMRKTPNTCAPRPRGEFGGLGISDDGQ